jgi:RimJ/RimL family protein N-acetyltransferase
VTAIDDLHAYVGSECALTTLLEIPDMAEKLLRMARQRLAAFITPIPIRLRDGTELYLRPVLPGDGERVLTDPVWFSPETHYRRYLSVCTPNEALLRYLSDVDYVAHFVWVVTDGVDGPVVADARFIRDAHDPTLAEVAFTVADVYQGRGLGTILVGALAVAGRMVGIERLGARVLANNAPARALLDQLHVQWERDEPGVLAATATLPDPTDLPVDSIAEIRELAEQVVRAFD